MFYSGNEFSFSGGGMGHVKVVRPRVQNTAVWGGEELFEVVNATAKFYCVAEDELAMVSAKVSKLVPGAVVEVIPDQLSHSHTACLIMIDRDACGLPSVRCGSYAYSAHAMAEGRVRDSCVNFVCVNYYEDLRPRPEPVSASVPVVIEGADDHLSALSLDVPVFCPGIADLLEVEAAFRAAGSARTVGVLRAYPELRLPEVALVLPKSHVLEGGGLSREGMVWLAGSGIIHVVHLTDDYATEVSGRPGLRSEDDGLCYRDVTDFDVGRYPTVGVLQDDVPGSRGWPCVSSAPGIWHVSRELESDVRLGDVPRSDFVGGSVVYDVARAAAMAGIVGGVGFISAVKSEELYDSCCLAAAEPLDVLAEGFTGEPAAERIGPSAQRDAGGEIEWRRFDPSSGVCFGLFKPNDPGWGTQESLLRLQALDGFICFRDHRGAEAFAMGTDPEVGRSYGEVHEFLVDHRGLKAIYFWFIPFRGLAVRVPDLAGSRRGTVPITRRLAARLGVPSSPSYDFRDPLSTVILSVAVFIFLLIAG